MRRVLLLAGSAAAFVAAVSFLPQPKPANAATAAATFIIPANDGYGVADCLATGGDCATGVANAWCVAQGYRTASAFGPASDITSSTGTSRSTAAAMAITCDN
ncbi:MAG: hypothetical protein KF735_16980 [Chelatococcus sp.]|uniref:hypothetical protein n=1 Tax=unclassified Chelatococcus TaxID=2638111 RepID=UPI001BCB9DF7|nr:MULTISPECIES: hypothetical protein [unclassified Chelatococcus]MBS7739218.1 hypothetical protein [Chelatococcus sp. HY11]MBX3539341.1 hypothetical protein [Chelatococcus sp.]MBX3543708.1 hypothetical protein [Chelatococcus sp.]MCO5076249.1 hypothetical protein [Chelatococcus sp.]